ncbi:Predicted O-linked N-acetylglucosamine transferase, SPINDLY family [Noviherbaspirillum humi]|uniref:protein O-GlcNAc transferase n=1 Tax=Noviherbaspirillum humi TaxID=1688639 RepID=A0A239FXY5_9BURK|nr:tetratricopeptide repeat protein [Noviherbaspirillum humi]SNS61749.1 Predicted O-linked N-acetylglucosamine transferase, SPINDLY family [Noviherbaspirillum humi]
MALSADVHAQAPAESNAAGELAQLTDQVLRTAATHYNQGRYAEAEALYREVLSIMPQHAEASHNMAVLLVQTRRIESSWPFFEAAITARPAQKSYWLNYIDALIIDERKTDAWEALELAQKMARLNAEEVSDSIARLVDSGYAAKANQILEPAQAQPLAEALQGGALRGGAGKVLPAARRKLAVKPAGDKVDRLLDLYNRNKLDQATKGARELTESYPHFGLGWKLLGLLLYKQGKVSEAIPPLQEAVELLPEDFYVHDALAMIFKEQGRLKEAETYFAGAMAARPDCSTTRLSLASIIFAQTRHKEVEAMMRELTRDDPSYFPAYQLLGQALRELGRQEEAVACLQKAVDLKPEYLYAHSTLLFGVLHNQALSKEDIFRRHLHFGKVCETLSAPAFDSHANSRQADRRLNIGFVSGDFYNHAVATFLEPILRHLAQDESLCLHAYHNTYKFDHYTERLKTHFAHWESVFELPDQVVAEKIRSDGIDILVDLSGHTGSNRLATLAKKPAPIQASWIGYPGTTGLKAVDYYLADPYLMPPGKFDSQFTEKIAYLRAQSPFSPPRYSPPVNALPALRNGFITFGSFNRINKLSQDVIRLWSRLLLAAPNARMFLGGMPPEGEYDCLIEWFEQEGIGRDRLEFHPRAGTPVYLQMHHHVDVCLDAFPYAGGTTTLNALWMGVPTLTITGATLPTQIAAWSLNQLGLGEFVSEGEEEFIRKALFWTENLEQLASLRSGMRDRFEQSPLMRPDDIAKDLSRLFRVMWQRWCAGEPPAVIGTDGI